jgi:hypothetical protein
MDFLHLFATWRRQHMNPISRFSKLAAGIACLIVGGLCIDGANSVAKADNIAYMGDNGGNFGTIDLNKGVFSLLGKTAIGGLPQFTEPLSGMAEANGTLYGASEGTNDNGQLYTIDPANGTLTRVGTTLISYDDFGSTTTGLYAVDSSGVLYSINAATGKANSIGSIGITLGGFCGLSNNDSSLYFANGNNLYTLNTTTGAATLIGSGLGNSIQLGVLLQENGTLYGGAWAPGQAVDTVDPGTGAATIGPDLTGTVDASDKFAALAPYPVSAAVPAPVIGHGLPVVLAVGGLLFGAKLLERSRKRRSFGAAIPHAAG